MAKLKLYVCFCGAVVYLGENESEFVNKCVDITTNAVALSKTCSMSLYSSSSYTVPSVYRAPLEKTRMCHYHLMSRCRYGSSCSFAHSPLELRLAPPSVRKTKLCPLYAAGVCLDNCCNFAHGLEDMRHSYPSVSPSLPPDSSSDQYMLLLDMLNNILTDHQTELNTSHHPNLLSVPPHQQHAFSQLP